MLDMNIKNNPIELVYTGYTGSTLRLKLGDDTNESLYFNGVFYLKPGNTYIGLDINKYIKDIVDYYDFDISNTSDDVYQLQNFTKDFYYYFYDLDDILLLSGNTYICNQNLKYNDWLKYIINQSFGKWNEYKNILTTDWSLPDMVDDYITNDFIYSYNNFNDSPYTRIWNKSLIGAPINLQMFNNSINDFDGSMTYSYYDNRYSNASYTSSSIPFSFNNKKSYNLYYNNPVSFSGKYYISINLLLTPSVPIIGLNTTTRSIFIELIDPSCYRNEVYQLYWLNRRGGVDWIVLNGKSYLTSKNTRYTYQTNQRSYINDEFIGDELTNVNPQYLAESQMEYNLNSDLLGNEYKYIEDLFSSSKVWLYSAQDESIKMVDVVDTDFLIKSNRNQNGTFNFNILLRDKSKNIFL